ncbi:PREDICTED: anoctamin-9-like isoform X2 [Papilio polytes]|uniref:anoctamin-9-like isoform X2 n=1 Tax=Papilio polytes TaxID=76194 RepID=UPI000675FC26|nr:PREDICTED: anoctamin-9-like isoform X2 [Papilio polytes]
MVAELGSTSESSGSIEPPKNNTERTFRDGVRKIDFVVVVVDEENIISDTLKHRFLTNIVKMGFEIEFENGVLPIHKKLVFFKVHCPNDVLNNLGKAFGVKCVQNARGEHIMSRKERDWVNVIRKQYPQPLQYSSLERSLIVYMALLNLPFGDRQNYIGLERLMKRNIVVDAYALHDGPYYIPKEASSINARQVLFYNWAGITNIFSRQPLNVVHEYFGPKIAGYFAFYGHFNFFLAIASIVALICLYLAIYRNEIYMNARETLCKPSIHYICADCKGVITYGYYYLVPVLQFCNIFSINIIVDNRYAPYFSAFIVLWGIFLTVFWIGKEKFLGWVWETPNKDYNRKQTRPEFKANFETAPKSRKTGITLIGRTRYGDLLILIVYIGLILFAVLVFAVVLELRKKQDPEYIIKERIETPEIVIPRLVYTMIGFSVVLFFLDIVHRILATYIVRKENHRTYESSSVSLIKHLYIMCFPMPVIMLGYFGFQRKIFKLWTGVEKVHEYGSPTEYNFSLYDNLCVMTSCLYELSFSFTVVLLLRFVLLRKLSFYSSLTDYNQRSIAQKIPCWEREFALPPFTEKFLINKMKILVMQFTLIIAFGYAWPPTIVVTLFFNMYDLRRDADLCTLHYRRPLLLKNEAFNTWTKILKLMVYLAIILNVCCNTRGYTYINDEKFKKFDYNAYLTIEELRTYQYMYIFIFEFVMLAIFMLSRFIFAIDVGELEMPRKRSQQQSEAKILQDIVTK